MKTINGVTIIKKEVHNGVYFYQYSGGWFYEIDWDYEEEGSYSRTFKTIEQAMQEAL